MISFIFPGQGSQYVGMGLDFYQQYPQAKSVFEQASDRLGIDMAKLCFESSEEELSLTFNAQPAILTASIAAYRVFQSEVELIASYTAGHSLGEYSALVASEAISFEDAVYTVRKRGEFMQEAVPVGVGSMCAVIGLDKEEVESACKVVFAEDSVVSTANFNSPQQTVISGHKKAVEKVGELCKNKGAKRVIPLSVSAPFHSILMQPAADKLQDVLNSVEISDANIEVVSNVTAEWERKSSIIKDLLVKQVVRPVRWTQSIEYLSKKGVNRFIEIGPGNVLSGLIRRTLKDISVENLEKTDQLTHINGNENGIKK